MRLGEGEDQRDTLQEEEQAPPVGLGLGHPPGTNWNNKSFLSAQGLL